MRVILVLLLLLYSFDSFSRPQYNITLQDAELLVSACFPEQLPSRLYRESSRNDAAFSSADEQLSFYKDSARIQVIPDNSCIQYQVDLTKLGKRNAVPIDGGWLIDTDSWLYVSGAKKLELSINTSSGQVTSTPWTKLDSQRYLLGDSPIDWSSKIAIGNLVQKNLTIGGADIELAMTNIPTPHQDKITAWITEATSAITTLYGTFPIKRTQVLVTDIGRRSEPVPWAEVQRGGTPSVHFYIDSQRDLSEFSADWTAVHEFSHLFIPYIDMRQKWISEGIATYFQNVLRAKQGMLTPQEGWQTLQRGFDKGKRFAKGMSVNNASSYKHMYWGGAALMFNLDMALQKESQGQHSLATVLREFSACCLPSPYHWDNQDLMRQFDKLGRTTLFTQMLNTKADAPGFPDYSLVQRFLSNPKNTSGYSIGGKYDVMSMVMKSATLSSNHENSN